jgi:hypothetical protein
MLAKLTPWLLGGVVVFALSWYLAIKFAMILIASAIGFGAGMAYQSYRSKKELSS